MGGLCKYSDIFGKPDTGAHKYKVGGIAIVDVGATFLLAFLIGLLLDYEIKGILCLFGILMIVSIAVHKLFCVDTALVRMLGI